MKIGDYDFLSMECIEKICRIYLGRIVVFGYCPQAKF